MTNIRGIKETILMARKEKGLTQKDMAKKLNISQPAYSYYEKGNKPLPANQLKKVLDILDINMEQLKELEDPLDSICRSLDRIAAVLEKIEAKM